MACDTEIQTYPKQLLVRMNISLYINIRLGGSSSLQNNFIKDKLINVYKKN